MATTVHITHIEDTWANLVAGADHGQVMIANDVTADLPYDEFIWVDDSGDKFYVAAAQKYWSVAGGSWTYLNAEFEDIDANGDIYASEYVYHLGDTDTYIRFRPDLISFFAGNVDLLELIEDTQDVVFVNYAQADVDFRVDWDGGTSLFARGSDGIVAIGGSSPANWDSTYTVLSAEGSIGNPAGALAREDSHLNIVMGAYFDSTDSRWEQSGGGANALIDLDVDSNAIHFYLGDVPGANNAITWRNVFDLEYSAGVVVNEYGTDAIDFRVETDNATHAIFVDASADDVIFNDSGATNFTMRVETDNEASAFVVDAANDAIIINDGTNLSYVRAEGASLENLLYVDCSGDAIGMGTGSPDRPLHVERDTATTDEVQYLLRLTETCSGTVADGFGVGMEFELENSTQSTNHVAARISAVWEDESDIDSDLIIEVNNGGSITEVCRVTSRGTINFASMPTSAVGLSSGDLWYDSSNGYVTQA